jgi:hypothetical protein
MPKVVSGDVQTRVLPLARQKMASANSKMSNCAFQIPAARGLAALPGFARTKTQGFHLTTPMSEKNARPKTCLKTSNLILDKFSRAVQEILCPLLIVP